MSNRLREEISPYLLQHADNPVDWYPWGPEALELARAQDRPIFLSVGYAACHWCHVMAHESFEDPEIAALMNEHFVNVKVDREERPDLDSLYMEAVVAMTGQGGWPMSVFLTPQGEPFYGGTYFPPERRHGLPGFKELLRAIAEGWRGDRRQLLAGGRELAARLAQPAALGGAGGLRLELQDRAAEGLFRDYDWRHGGWGRAPKFPQPLAIEFLLRRHARSGDKLALDMALGSLRAMAAGGIHDQLGGGFARYSVDDRWLVPHFEKMLYDNAQLARVYLLAWKLSGDPALLAVADSTLDFMLLELGDPAGGLYSSLDADSEGVEGRFYVWSLGELEAALGEQRLAGGSGSPGGEGPRLAALFAEAYGATAEGNFEDRNVLSRVRDDRALAEQFGLPVERVAEELRRARARLLAARGRRVRPGLDDKVLTAWNGLALATLAEAAAATGRQDRLEAAQRLAGFLLEHLMESGRLRRAWRKGQARNEAFLEDHAQLGLGLLALYQVDFDLRWYAAAVAHAEEILEAYADPQGGCFDTRHDHERLIARPKSLQDTPTASGNAAAASLLLQLAALTGERRYAEPAEAAAAAMQELAARHPTAFSAWLCAIHFALGPQLQLALAGDPADPDFQALARTAQARYLPNLVIAGGEPGAPSLPPLLADRPRRDGRPTAYLCQGFVCNLPVTTPEALAQQLDAVTGAHPAAGSDPEVPDNSD
jgi:hypothetical protein